MPLVATALAETALEAHELGLGNLQRYVETYRPSPEGIVVEDYAVVVPSSLEPGDYTLRVGLQDPFHRGDETAFQGEAVNLAVVQIR